MAKPTMNDFDKVLKSLHASLEAQNDKNTVMKEMRDILTGLSAKVDSLRYVFEAFVQTSETKAAAPKTKAKAKAKGGKSKALDEPEEAPEESDNKDEPVEEANSTEEKKEDKKTKAKPRVKTTKASNVEVKSTRPLNKMEFFRRQFSEDPTAFDTYLTKAVKDELEKKHAKEWETIKDPAKVETARCSVYYNWMSTNHEGMLQNMKNNYNDDLAKRNMVIAEKDED
jgi:uncharacterized protein YeaO (DUF488 family)